MQTHSSASKPLYRNTPYNTIKITHDRTALQRRVRASCESVQTPVAPQTTLTPTVDLDLTPPSSPDLMLLDVTKQPSASTTTLLIKNKDIHPPTKPVSATQLVSPHVSARTPHHTIYNSTPNNKLLLNSDTITSLSGSQPPQRKTNSYRNHRVAHTQPTPGTPRLFTLRQTIALLPDIEPQPAITPNLNSRANRGYNDSTRHHPAVPDLNNSVASSLHFLAFLIYLLKPPW